MTKARRTVLLVAVFVFLMIGFTGSAQPLVVDKTLHDFGLAQDGERVSTEFILTNNGTTAITISNVDYNCSCTSYAFMLDGERTQRAPYTVPAGQSVRMQVTFNTRGYARTSQPVFQILTVRSNDPERASFQVTIRANVVATLPSHKALPSELVEAHFFLVDLRTPEAFAEGHLFGAINIPFEEMEVWLPELPLNAMYVLYDTDGSVAAQATWEMANSGHGGWWGRVHSMEGGLVRWVQHLGGKYFVGDPAVISQDEGGSFWAGFSLDPTAIAAEYLIVIDLSSPEMFAQVHMPGSVNLEEQDAVSWALMLPDLLGLSSIAEVVLWILDGEEGTPSCSVAQELIDLGFVASCVRGGRAALQQETGDTYLWAWHDKESSDGE